MAPKNPHAVILGRKGGRATSERKAQAVRENGKKGGRPKNPTKRSKVWIVERSNWFGECEMVANFHTRREAWTERTRLQREADAVEDPADKVTYTIAAELWERPA